MKFTLPLFFSIIIMLISCKKDAKPVQELDDSLTILTKAYYYYGEPSGNPMIDSIYYNAKHQIEKVVSTSASIPNTAIYQLTYNNNGDLSTVKGNRAYWSVKQDYSFYYNAKRRLDSLVILDNSYYDDSFCMTFSYDANDHIKGSYTYFLKANIIGGLFPGPATGDPLNSSSFYRNGNNGIDSVYSILYSTGTPYGTLINKLFTHFGAAGTSDINTIDKSYLFILATRPSPYLCYTINPFWYQYLNPDVPMFKGGTFTEVNTNPINSNTNQPFTCNVIPDERHRIQLINITGWDLADAKVKLQYAKIAR